MRTLSPPPPVEVVRRDGRVVARILGRDGAREVEVSDPPCHADISLIATALWDAGAFRIRHQPEED